MTDEELIQLIHTEGRQPDGRALPMLYARWGIAMKAYFLSQGVSLPDAEDILSETFVKIWRSAASFEGQGSARAWCWTIARNTLHDRLRKLQQDACLELDPDAGLDVCDLPPDPDDMEGCVNDGLERFALDEPERAYVLQLLVAEVPVAEIAERIGRSYAATRTFMSESRKKLKPYILHCLELLVD